MFDLRTQRVLLLSKHTHKLGHMEDSHLLIQRPYTYQQYNVSNHKLVHTFDETNGLKNFDIMINR